MDIIMAQRLAIMQQAIHLPRHLLIVVGVQFQSSLRDSRGSNRERGLGVGGGHSKKNDRESAYVKRIVSVKVTVTPSGTILFFFLLS